MEREWRAAAKDRETAKRATKVLKDRKSHYGSSGTNLKEYFLRKKQ